MSIRPWVSAACLAVLGPPLIAAAEPQRPADVLRQVAFEQRLGEPIPADIRLRDHTGQPVRFGDFLGQKRPLIVTLVYYECPMLCTLELNGLVSTLRTLDLAPGRDFEIVTVSFNPQDTPDRAAAKRKAYLQQYGRAEAEAGWHFLTGDEPEIERLCEAAGFRYVYDKQTGQYAHASGIVLLTPQGRIARYFYGIEYPPRDLRLGLVEASGGRIGLRADQLLLLCYGYDPATGKYGFLIMNVLRAAGLATVLAIAGAIGAALWRERTRARRAALQTAVDHAITTVP